MNTERSIVNLISKLGRLSQSRRPGTDVSNLTILNLQLLSYLFFNEEPPRTADIAAYIGVSLPSISVMIDRLEAEGYVRRSNDPIDKRIVRTFLTDKGSSVIRSEIDRTTRAIKYALENFDEKEKRVIIDFLETYINVCEKEFNRR